MQREGYYSFGLAPFADDIHILALHIPFETEATPRLFRIKIH